MNQLRIIGGKWRGRKISFPDQKGLRPSPDRIRETIFNWLQSDIVGANCLDLFAGSGALAIEAASRGAGMVCCIELSQETAASIKNNIKQLQAEQISLKQQDALKFIQKNNTGQKFNIVFLDPPFAENLLEECCALLEKHAWLENSAFIYLESDQGLEKISLPANWSLIKHKKAGQVSFGLCKRTE